MSDKNLDRLFNPKSVAIVGASDRVGSVGHDVMKNLLSFKGKIFPVNPKRDIVQGVKAYQALTKIPGNIDLVVVATPAFTVPQIVKDAAKKKVGGMIIISAGFKEAGPEGIKLFEEVRKIAKKAGIRIIGPNCLGMIRPKHKLNASFASKMALKGNVALLSQSGALCTAILDWSIANNVGFSYFISLGSMVDISFHDLIEYFDKDKSTSSILIYMESLSNPSEFLKTARKYTPKKPIIVLKVGRSAEGANAAMSHTGSLSGNDGVFDAAFKRAGVIRVHDSHELFDCAQILAKQKRPKGNRLAIITNAGGPGVISTDSLIEQKGQLAELSKKTINKLNKSLPTHWSHGNPVDVLGDADPIRYRKAVEAVMNDDNVDGVLVILTPQSMTNSVEIAKEIVKSSKKNGKKTILACWMGEDDVEEGREVLERENIPVFRMPENAIRGFLTLYKSTHTCDNLPNKINASKSEAKLKSKKLINKIKKEGRFTLTEYESKKLISYYCMPTAPFDVADKEEKAVLVANKIGYPVAMKILSPDILHKTDVGGVKINIKDEKEVRKAFNQITKSAKKKAPKAKIQGVFIEKMETKKYEILIGSTKDPVFGPTVVFGKGGVTVELYKDTTIGLVPIDKQRAKMLMKETKVYELLKGYRGMKGADLNYVEELLCCFSTMLMDLPELKEVDINPLSIDHTGGVVLDAKVVLDQDYKSSKERHYVIPPEGL